MSTVNWCEKDYATWSEVAEFWNTVSNLAIVVAGVSALADAQHSARKKIWPACAALVLVGAGSAAFHATLTRETQAMDELSMIVFNAAYVYAGTRRWLLPGTYVAVATAVYFVLDDQYWAFLVLFGAGLLAVAVVAHRASDERRVFWTAVACFAVGFAAWLVDKLACDETGYWGGHALWHVFVAAGAYLALRILGMQTYQELPRVEHEQAHYRIDCAVHYRHGEPSTKWYRCPRDTPVDVYVAPVTNASYRQPGLQVPYVWDSTFGYDLEWRPKRLEKVPVNLQSHYHEGDTHTTMWQRVKDLDLRDDLDEAARQCTPVFHYSRSRQRYWPTRELKRRGQASSGATFDRDAPVYYVVYNQDNHVWIRYYLYYAYQAPVLGIGAHHFDAEEVHVRLYNVPCVTTAAQLRL